MQLSYLIRPFDGDSKRCTVKAAITTEHSSSSYGQPVIVLEDGGAIDLMSWAVCGYKVVRATLKEKETLARMGFMRHTTNEIPVAVTRIYQEDQYWRWYSGTLTAGNLLTAVIT